MNCSICPLAGILYGTMTLELGGKVTIECQKTNCFSELEFKLKVLFLHSFHSYASPECLTCDVTGVSVFIPCSRSLEEPAL